MSVAKSYRSSHLFRCVVELDRILRGETTRLNDLRRADIKIPVLGIAAVIILLAVVYGFCMGVFALVRGVESQDFGQALLQVFASMSKVPLLYLMTLVVTFPSLYVFNALVGSQLKVLPVLKLLVASLAVNLSVLASMGPILAFFSVSTPNYSFIVLLNVVVFSIAGGLGLVFLIQTLNRLVVVERERREVTNTPIIATELPIDSATKGDSATVPANTVPHHANLVGPLDHEEGVVLGKHVRKVFACWIVLFGLVGAQMGWVLRPFIGSPNSPFEWFRPRESSFFQSVFETIQNLVF